VHGACGIWGVLAVPLFDIHTWSSNPPTEDLYGPGIPFGQSVFAQVMGIATILVWTSVCTGAMFMAIKALGLLRVEEASEKFGLDASEFSPKSAYSTDMDLIRLKVEEMSPKTTLTFGKPVMVKPSSTGINEMKRIVPGVDDSEASEKRRRHTEKVKRMQKRQSTASADGLDKAFR
jgi:hypothetical protein